MTQDDVDRRGRLANLLGALAVGVDDAVRAAFAEAVDLDASAVAALLVVRERPGRSITDLAAALGLTHSGAVRVADRLAARELATRDLGRDGRSRGLGLTEAGHERTEQALAARRAVLQGLADTLPPRRQADLMAAVEELLARLPGTRQDAWRICRTCEHDTCRGTECPVGSAVAAEGRPPLEDLARPWPPTVGHHTVTVYVQTQPAGGSDTVTGSGAPPDESYDGAGEAPWRAATVAVTAGRPTGPGDPFNVPPTFASTYRDGGTVGYGRWGNPTWTALEQTLGALEGGSALTFASGQAALTAVLETMPHGATVLLPRDAYLGTRGFLADVAARGRLTAIPVEMTDTSAVLTRLPDVDLLWVESPVNPLLGVVDLREVLQAASAAGIPSVVDNTFATPVLQRPLDFGATAVMHSATKFIGGHSDLLLGAVVTRDEDLLQRLLTRRTLHGAIPGTQEAWLALRGLRTLPLRIDRAQASAQLLAERLDQSPAVATVRYPGLPSHPGHELAARQMRGPGAVLSFDLDGAAAAEAVTSQLRLIVGSTSLGGVETTIDRRNRWPGEEQVPPGLLRLSVGIEDAEDLWEDLDRALHS